MTALTLGKIIRLLGFTFPLPPPIAQTGFPEGAAVCIAAPVEQKPYSHYQYPLINYFGKATLGNELSF